MRTILEGSVRRAGNRIRVTAQLIEAQNGSYLWSERYEFDMTDIFAVQDEIGQAISEALKVRLAPRTRTVDIGAYQNYLKGQYHFLRLTPESLAKAKDFFERSPCHRPELRSGVQRTCGVLLLSFFTRHKAGGQHGASGEIRCGKGASH